MIYLPKYYGLFEESKGRKNAYYGKVQELTCTPNLEGYDPACRHKNVHNQPLIAIFTTQKIKTVDFHKNSEYQTHKNMS